MQHAALVIAARLACVAGVLFLSCSSPVLAGPFTNAAECRMQWDDEFASYARQYNKCGPECWTGDARRHEYLRYSDWLNRLEIWHEFCRAMSGGEPQLHGTDASAAWPVSLRTEGQSSCDLIRSGEVKYKFQWKEKQGKRCYSNSGVRKHAAACC